MAGFFVDLAACVKDGCVDSPSEIDRRSKRASLEQSVVVYFVSNFAGQVHELEDSFVLVRLRNIHPSMRAMVPLHARLFLHCNMTRTRAKLVHTFVPSIIGEDIVPLRPTRPARIGITTLTLTESPTEVALRLFIHTFGAHFARER